MLAWTKMSVVRVLCFVAVLHCISGFVLKSDEEKLNEEKKDIKRIIEILRKEKLQKLVNVHIEHKNAQRNAEEENQKADLEVPEEEEIESSLSLFNSTEAEGFENSESDTENESEEEELEDVEGLEDRSLDSKEKGHGAEIDENVEPEDDPELFSVLNSFLDEKNGVQVQGAGVNKAYKTLKDSMDSHRLTHQQKVEMGLESEYKGEEKRNFYSNTKILWPQGIVPYEISTVFSISERNVILRAIDEVANKTCVKFQPKASTNPSQLGHNSYIEFFSENGCWSYVGRVFDDKQQISLQKGGCVTNSITIHEMLHAIGQTHEQSRNDRDNYVTMLWNNIQGGRNNNNMAKENTLDNNQYDYESVLQYSLTAFSTNGLPTMKFSDRRLEFLANSAVGLTFYDIKDITVAYQCTSGCSVKSCQNGGFQDHTCKCFCPDGLKGDLCDQVDTDNVCGGIIDVSGGPATIKSPNYPSNYDVNTICTWLIKAGATDHIKVDIDDLHLTDNGGGRCYHWLEIQYNLIGQTGPRRCGDVVGENYVTSVAGQKNLMLLRFDSKFSNDRPSSKGFSLTVKAVGAGCANNPCVRGTCSATAGGGFTCACDQGFSGTTCNIPSVTASFSCTFQDQQCFLGQATDDQFDWTIKSGPTPSSGTGPDNAQSGSQYLYAETSSPRVQGDVARMVSTYNMPATARCLRFWYHMLGSNVGMLAVATSGTTLSKNSIWSQTGDQGASWKQATLDIPSTDGLKVYFEATRGDGWEGDIAIDTVELTPGSCSSPPQTTHVPTTQAPTTQAPTTQAPTTPQNPCNPNPCNNGGLCLINVGSGCVCADGYAGQFCDLTVTEFYNCNFENSECFLRNATNDNHDWTLNSGSTPSSNTGPTTAHSLPNYIYFETSSPVSPGETAKLESYNAIPVQNHCLSFWYHMYGGSVGNLQISTSGSGVLWTKSGDQGDRWIQAKVNLPADPNFKLVIEATRGDNWNGDIALDDVKLTNETCSPGSTLPPTTAAPVLTFTCTFEPGTPCFLQQESLDTFDWTYPQSGSTPSSNTGPNAASEGSFYAFIEASSPRVDGDVAILMSNILPLEDFCLTFDYHMFGSSMGTLNVLINDPTATSTMSLLWSESGDQGSAWHNAAVQIPATPSLRVFFEGIRSTGYTGDAAIDNIVMMPGTCGCAAQPCQNGGQCSEDALGQVTCSCLQGFTGTFCESFDGTYIACSFEDNEPRPCFLTQELNDNFDWTIRQGSTPSSDTGPSAAFDGNKYAFIETSSPRTQYDFADLYADLGANSDERCLSFAYHMYGSNIGSLDIYHSDGQQLVNAWTLSGNQGDFWQTAAVKIPAMNNGQLYITGVRGNGYRGDIAIDDVELKTGKCGCLGSPCRNGGTCTVSNNVLGFTCSCDSGYTGDVCENTDGSTLQTCTFENGTLCFMHQVNAGVDVFDWTIQHGGTPSSDTGPDNAHTGLKYAYIEGSTPRQAGDNAILSTEQQTFPSMDRCLRFYYHMKGSSIGTLMVLAGNRGQETQVWSKSGVQGDNWQYAQVDLPSTSDLVVAIEGVRGNGWSSDIAVDDLELSPGLC